MTRKIKVGTIEMGGGSPVTVQSMCNTKTTDIDATVAQINRLAEIGCDIMRVAVPTIEAAEAIKEIKSQISVPLVADIHFDYKLALKSIESGVDKLRINPGNIGKREYVEAVAKAAAERNIPIRIGANSGSIDRSRYGLPDAESLVASALDEAKILEDMGFYDIILSLKASDVMTMIEAYTLASEKCDYPLHLGVTEAGLAYQGSIKSAVGIGSLLSRGIGDTIRVSLTADVEEEVRAAKEILASLNLRQKPYNLVSCPTCGRTEIDLVGLAREVSRRLDKNPPRTPITVAVMGCVVNGPGEASMADVGIAGGKGCGLVFKKGEIIDKVPEDKLVDALMEVIESGEKKAAKAETTGVVIRKAKVDDIPDIQRIINSFAAKDEMLPRSLNALYEDIRDFYVLEENGKIVGCCALHICWSDLAEIRSLAVTEEAQGKGYGKLITERCIENAKEMGVPRVFALTYVDGFFKRLGFGKIENSKLPQKIWSDCINCPKFPDCNEIAVVKDLTEEVNK